MQPMPCPHCGVNFMRRNTDCTQSEVCNNCTVREQIRNPKKETPMETVDILIKVPTKDYKLIEECCINKGISFTKYFMEYHLPAKKDNIIFVEVPEVEKEQIYVVPEAVIIPKIHAKHTNIEVVKEKTKLIEKRKYNKRK